jgi:hypothetical protein
MESTLSLDDIDISDIHIPTNYYSTLTESEMSDINNSNTDKIYHLKQAILLYVKALKQGRHSAYRAKDGLKRVCSRVEVDNESISIMELLTIRTLLDLASQLMNS